MSNPIYPSDYNNPSQNIFERLGHPGKWNSVSNVTGNSEFNFTGSNSYGVSGIIIDTAGQTIHLSNGGTIPGSALLTKTIHELSISKIVSTGGTAYVLYRNTKVI
jgi:hypothetical protein